MRTPCLLALLVAPGLPAMAEPLPAPPPIVVGEDVPFDAGELAEALAARGAATNGPIRVTRHGRALVIEVGDRLETVSTDARDPRDDARVVAMLIVALGDASPPQPADRETPPVRAEVDHESPPVQLEHAPVLSPWSIRATIARMRDNNGLFTTPLAASLAYRVAPSARAVIGIGLATVGSHITDTAAVPLRLGVEGRAGAAGLELGAFVAPSLDCAGELTAASGTYGAVRVYLPLGDSAARMIVEGGGHYAFGQRIGCDRMFPDTTLLGESYAGYLGGGVEWPL